MHGSLFRLKNLIGRKIGGEIVQGVHDLHLTCLAFDSIHFRSIGIFSAGVLFKNFKSMEKPHSSSYALQDH